MTKGERIADALEKAIHVKGHWRTDKRTGRRAWVNDFTRTGDAAQTHDSVPSERTTTGERIADAIAHATRDEAPAEPPPTIPTQDVVRRVYHVVGPGWRKGEDVLCPQTLLDRGKLTEDDYKWSEDVPLDADGWIDADLVCVFDTVADAKAFVRRHAPDGRILAIDIDKDHTRSETTAWEGYRAYRGHIPAALVAGVVKG